MKFIVTALVAATVGVVGFAVPAQAEAANLPMWQAKREARKDLRDINYPDPVTIDWCSRKSRSKVVCEWHSDTYDGFVCDGRYSWRKSWTGVILLGIVRSIDCWDPSEPQLTPGPIRLPTNPG